MLCFLQIALFVVGINILIKGKTGFGDREVTGTPAYIIGTLLLLPLPLAFGFGAILGVWSTSSRSASRLLDNGWFLPVAELSILAFCGIPALVIALLSGRERVRPKRSYGRRRRYEDQDRHPRDYGHGQPQPHGYGHNQPQQHDYGHGQPQPYGYGQGQPPPGQPAPQYNNPSAPYPPSDEANRIQHRPSQAPQPQAPIPDEDDYESPRRRSNRNASRGSQSAPWWALGMAAVAGCVCIVFCGSVVLLFMAPRSQSKTEVIALQTPNPNPDNDPEAPNNPNPNPPNEVPQPGTDLVANEHEQPNPPAQIPFAVDPNLINASGNVYLSDLQEFAVTEGPDGWKFAKNGQLGDGFRQGATVEVDGTPYSKGLGMHPPFRDSIRACYQIAKRAKAVSGKVAINDGAFGTRITLRFAILGDGKLLWRSPVIRRGVPPQPFNVDVSQVNLLELRTYTDDGLVTHAHAVWLDPYVVVK